MILTAVHQLRFILSIAFGIPFSPASLEQFVAATRRTIDEFGGIGKAGAELIGGIALDAETQREMQIRRFRGAVRRAAETPYYADLLRHLKIEPAELTLETINRIPITSKTMLRSCPDDFVRTKHTSRSIDAPVLRATTTGTTDTPTSIYFSQREMRTYFALAALGMLHHGTIDETDIVQISVNARGMLGNLMLAGGAAHVGALVYQTGVIAPESALFALAEKRHIQGKKSKASILYTYPSYLGALVETGLAQGFKPSDFGLKCIAIGGEIVTEGLKTRARELFGDVAYVGDYGITELWGMGSHADEAGNLVFDVSQGLLEIIDPDTGNDAAPGQIGTIVGTPFPPYRETTILLRYDTEDLVRAVEQHPGSQRCSHILGKKRLSIHHEDGTWTTPRDVMEVLEGCEAVPLPARFALYPQPSGVGIDVVTYSQDAGIRRNLEARFEAVGVRLRRLNLCAYPHELSHSPYPLRGDLREATFDDRIWTTMRQVV
jgi:phenylacetate-CoA ligase